MAAKIVKGDEVVILTGKTADKGKHGRVVRVIPDKHQVVVEGFNMVSKNVKPNKMTGEPGKIIKKEAPIDVSNVAIYNPETGKADRVGFDFVDGKKIRIYKSTKKEIVK
ncbi:MAG: 50S ribosomal protein L24 [Succinivibrionaceae bacterium]|nr:50S ribosomal protein L24 [Succinivibrionaceae bacterium]